ncbi:MAG: aspartate carbamoyltransferase catalytic subunit [Chitinophagales bacterium]|nr:aspartate carbamoyltransferase catalytic subunit [Chitinophagales bacterium]MDW8427399.1 aspartate carbamoyltransferase catalytic subunit [Chitinophagales bacterium]
MTEFGLRHLLTIRELDRLHIEQILSTAEDFLPVLERPIKQVPSLRHITVLHLFYESSTRTRISFELAARRLSAQVVNFSVAGSSVAKGESLLDTARNIQAMKVDLVVIRHHSSGAAHFLSQHLHAGIINAGDGVNEHPTQALLDAFTLRRSFAKLEGLKIALIGDILHSRVARSNIYCLTRLGAQVCVCGPPSLIPVHIEALGAKVTYDVVEALRWCDVAYVLRIQLERQHVGYFPSLQEYADWYGVHEQAIKQAGRRVPIMHPGPVNRGVELTAELADSSQSLILQQVTYGVAVRMAVLYLLAQQVQA